MFLELFTERQFLISADLRVLCTHDITTRCPEKNDTLKLSLFTTNCCGIDLIDAII